MSQKPIPDYQNSRLLGIRVSIADMRIINALAENSRLKRSAIVRDAVRRGLTLLIEEYA
jgi:hypothetical protein